MNSLFNRLYHEQKGQALYIVAVLMIALLGMAALSIDIGFLLHAQRELQATTDAAASAGGAAMPSPSLTSSTSNDVYSVVKNYAGMSSSLYNYRPDLNVTTLSVSFACVVSTTSPYYYSLTPCATSPNGSYPTCTVSTANPAGGCNAIKVTETAKVPTFFGKVFGITSVNISATSTASASGGGTIPYHVMLVLDSTASMGSTTDTGCISSNLSANYTAEQCAQLGVQVLLDRLSPCPPGPGYSNCAESIAPDPVALMTFPGLTPSETTTLTYPPVQGATADVDYDCSSKTNPSITPYNNNPAYLIVPFSSNYRLSDTSSTLNFGNSDLVDAVAANTDGCAGIQTPGGEGTFYAGALLEAQAYLTYNHVAGTQDVIIFMSDGDANASSSQLDGSVAQTAPIGGLTSKGTFSTTGECTQAVNAADYDKGLGTEIFSISYNSGSSGCTSGETAPYTTPCATMQGIASLPLDTYFFSVPSHKAGTSSTICPYAVQLQYLDQVYFAIGGDLMSARLIPAGATGSTTWTAATQ